MILRRIARWLVSDRYSEARLRQARATAREAFDAAIRAGDTRRQHEAWPALRNATCAQIAAEIGRAPSQWRGRA